MSLASLYNVIKSCKANFGVVPVDYGSTLEFCRAARNAGYGVDLLGADHSIVREWPAGLELGQSDIGTGICVYDALCVVGDWFGCPDPQVYKNALTALGRVIKPGTDPLVLLCGRIAPRFARDVLKDTLLMGGMLRVGYDLRIGYISPSLIGPAVYVSGDNDVVTSIAAKAAEALHDIPYRPVEQVDYSVLEGLALAEASYKALDTARAREVRRTLIQAKCDAEAVMRYLPGTQPAVQSVEAGARDALKQQVKLSQRNQSRLRMLEAALDAEHVVSAKAIAMLMVELAIRDIKFNRAKVAVVGDPETPCTTGAHRWMASELWKNLKARGFKVKYCDSEYSKRVHYRSPEFASSSRVLIKEGFDAAIVVATRNTIGLNNLMRSIPIVIDCCGACPSRYESVIQV